MTQLGETGNDAKAAIELTTPTEKVMGGRGRYRLVQVGWRYPYGGFMHGMEWRTRHPEHVQHEKCVPLYVIEEQDGPDA